MSLSLFQVDAFADRAFSGNPAAVCLLDAPREEAWMQRVAAEMNLSETAFLVPRTGTTVYDLRWFTPRAEVNLCGHATLASAHILWERGRLSPGEPALFETRSGRLAARRRPDGRIAMDFPADPEVETAVPEGLVEALGVAPVYVGKSREDYLVLLDDAGAVRALRPDMTRLEALDTRGVIVTAAAGGTFDFVSRFFAPRLGIPEDPVTGSAHCCLGPFWQARLGKTEMTGFQASERGGVVRVRVGAERVEVAGRAVTVMEAQLLVDEPQASPA
ncbi:PhzF family phenazine biosynthesis protein [Rhodocaloribacter sp.]